MLNFSNSTVGEESTTYAGRPRPIMLNFCPIWFWAVLKKLTHYMLNLCFAHVLFMFAICCSLLIMCCSCSLCIALCLLILILYIAQCPCIMCCSCLYMLLIAHYVLLMFITCFPMFDNVLLTFVHCSLLIMCGYVHNYYTLQLAMPQYI